MAEGTQVVWLRAFQVSGLERLPSVKRGALRGLDEGTTLRS